MKSIIGWLIKRSNMYVKKYYGKNFTNKNFTITVQHDLKTKLKYDKNGIHALGVLLKNNLLEIMGSRDIIEVPPIKECTDQYVLHGYQDYLCEQRQLRKKENDEVNEQQEQDDVEFSEDDDETIMDSTTSESIDMNVTTPKNKGSDLGKRFVNFFICNC